MGDVTSSLANAGFGEEVVRGAIQHACYFISVITYRFCIDNDAFRYFDTSVRASEYS